MQEDKDGLTKGNRKGDEAQYDLALRHVIGGRTAGTYCAWSFMQSKSSIDNDQLHFLLDREAKDRNPDSIRLRYLRRLFVDFSKTFIRRVKMV